MFRVVCWSAMPTEVQSFVSCWTTSPWQVYFQTNTEISMKCSYRYSIVGIKPFVQIDQSTPICDHNYWETPGDQEEPTQGQLQNSTSQAMHLRLPSDPTTPGSQGCYRVFRTKPIASPALLQAVWFINHESVSKENMHLCGKERNLSYKAYCDSKSFTIFK